MRFKELGKSGIKISTIGIGCWAIGGDAFWGKNDDRKSIAALQSAVDSGINLIDTAPGYGDGHSEEVVGAAMQGRRDKVVLATKCGIPIDTATPGVCNSEYDVILRQCDESLKRLKTDYIDIYQVHWPDFLTPVDETMAAMAKLKEMGKIRAIGVSNYDEGMLAAALACVQVDSQQPQFSLLHTVNEPIMEFGFPQGVGVLSYGSLGSGILSGKYAQKPAFAADDARSRMYGPLFEDEMWTKINRLLVVLREIAEQHQVSVGQVAINWTAQHPLVTSALVGARSPEQAAENAAAGNWELTDAEISRINAAHKEIFGGGLLGKRAVWDGSRRAKFSAK